MRKKNKMSMMIMKQRIKRLRMWRSQLCYGEDAEHGPKMRYCIYDFQYVMIQGERIYIVSLLTSLNSNEILLLFFHQF